MSFKFNALARNLDAQGKGASRRLRRENLVPAIVYGGEGEPVTLSLRLNELVKALQNDAFFSSIIDIELDGESTEVIIKAMQRHPAKGVPMHVDFQRIVRGQLMSFTVPVRYIGGDEAQTKAGGIFSSVINELEIECLPRHLPETIEVDVSGLNVGDNITLGAIKLPENVNLKDTDADKILASMGALAAVEVEPAPETEAAADILDGLIGSEEPTKE